MDECNSVDKDDLIFEYMINRLRLMEDIPFSEFENYTGLKRNLLEKQLQQAVAKELMIVDKEVCRVTPLGHRYLNELLTIFMD